ncbi:hypothetical protein [Staphylococcus saprophyticus]|uniref:hypothetical protein n=2 Tax=Staphylococcus TaxID=1279 RepID=UPI000D1A06F9|nr:hypothetical protein [Staphylococcus saprophyticus]PUZ32488.1 hypothetical protein BU606_06840 [Staphylococcus arlettae]RIO21218.1 hypothetical protein BUZ82_12430 [Staphylococcus saprophyticus]
MRVQMRLSQEARIILEEMKLITLKSEGINLTFSDIFNRICSELKTDYLNIDWLKVYNHTEYESIIDHYTSINPTALSLNDDSIELITNLITIFNKQLEMQRTVYKSFVVRMILKAYVLKQDKHKIYF